MLVARRFLPSMSLLCAFEAAARHQSFTAAAEELSLTQSAISRQIRSLETLLGTDLFSRERQAVQLTLAGETYAHEIRDALRHISTATLSFRVNPMGGILNLAVLPTFGTRWLAPRLPAFKEANPNITINLSTKFAPFDFNAETLHAAIHYGHPTWPGAEVQPLMQETVVPAFSGAYKGSALFRRPSDLRSATLLHLESRPDAWERWFRAKGIRAHATQGMLLDHFATIAQAAASGLGVALLPKFLIERELERGDLMTFDEGELESEERYYLVWPPKRSAYPPLNVFRRWLFSVAE